MPHGVFLHMVNDDPTAVDAPIITQHIEDHARAP